MLKIYNTLSRQLEDFKPLEAGRVSFYQCGPTVYWTQHIGNMRAMVQTLLDKGFAYTTPKAVYFDISKAKDYTKLSGQKLELNREGAGKGDVSDPGKRHAADFALWFFRTGVHKNALQYWPSPFV